MNIPSDLTIPEFLRRAPQLPLAPAVDTAAACWQSPAKLPDLRRVEIIALDTETLDKGIAADRGSAWPWRDGYICGVSVAYRADDGIRSYYFPMRHPDSKNFTPEQVYQWVRDHIAAGVRFVTMNGVYDFGWLRTEAGILMPPAERLEEIGALATMIDENRRANEYSLDALCAWRGLPGKDEALLYEGIEALGLITNKRKKVDPRSYIWQLPARYVGPYSEADAANTLALYESLNPIINAEGARAAYRLEVDLLPPVLEMRLRGIRVDQSAAEQARDAITAKRDATLKELSEQLGELVGIAEIRKTAWQAQKHDAYGISYPRTKNGAPSFKGGARGWMTYHPHFLPRLIARAKKSEHFASTFLGKHVIGSIVNGRIYADIHPHRGEDGAGAKTTRFSYSRPPLQQMPKHDDELAPLIRSCFLPEEGELWATLDASQQEYRLMVHFAELHNLPGAKEAGDRYRNDPKTDFHDLTAEMVSISRKVAKTVNFGDSVRHGRGAAR